MIEPRFVSHNPSNGFFPQSITSTADQVLCVAAGTQALPYYTAHNSTNRDIIIRKQSSVLSDVAVQTIATGLSTFGQYSDGFNPVTGDFYYASSASGTARLRIYNRSSDTFTLNLSVDLPVNGTTNNYTIWGVAFNSDYAIMMFADLNTTTLASTNKLRLFRKVSGNWTVQGTDLTVATKTGAGSGTEYTAGAPGICYVSASATEAFFCLPVVTWTSSTITSSVIKIIKLTLATNTLADSGSTVTTVFPSNNPIFYRGYFVEPSGRVTVRFSSSSTAQTFRFETGGFAQPSVFTYEGATSYNSPQSFSISSLNSNFILDRFGSSQSFCFRLDHSNLTIKLHASGNLNNWGGSDIPTFCTPSGRGLATATKLWVY